MAAIRQKIEALLAELCDGLYEREEAMKLTLLTAIAGESIFLLGPPGVGKSLIARRLKHAFRDGTSFEYLMTKFSTPDEVFGPVSIRKLKDEDTYERLTDRYMPGANIVFLDEIWKASSAIQNALLTIIHEKVYRNGAEDEQVDLKGLVTASNELPPDGESFGPLWDRLLLRYSLDGIRDQRKFLSMITQTEDVYDHAVTEAHQITSEDLAAWDAAIDAVEVPDEVLSTIQLIRHKLDQHNQQHQGEKTPIHTYDRRWKKIVRLLRTSAFLNDRQHVDLMDCFLIVHALWNDPKQLPTIREMVGETIRKHGYSLSIKLNTVRQELEAFEEEVEAETTVRHTVAEEVLRPHDDEYYRLNKDREVFEGTFIRIKDFNRLKLGDPEVINLYDDGYSLVNRLKAEKAPEQNHVTVAFNSVNYTYALASEKKERTEVIPRQPHSLLIKFWNERFDRLQSYLFERQEELRTKRPKELDQVEVNLFIDRQLSGLVTANLEGVIRELEQLALRLEKVRHRYEHIPKAVRA